MVTMVINQSQNDDPRKLRGLLDKVVTLAVDHQLKSVLVGMSCAEGDLVFSDLVDFVGSTLRVDDSIFRMTRTRVVFFLADADRNRAEEIMERVIRDFNEQFAAVENPADRLYYFEVAPGKEDVTLKLILPALFSPQPAPQPDTH